MIPVSLRRTARVEGQPGQFHNMLVELGLLAATVVVLAGAIWILRYSSAQSSQAEKLRGE